MQTTTVHIKGMTCSGCVNSIKTVLEKIPGVSSVDVSLENAQATIQHDPSSSSYERFSQAIKDAGFEVTGQQSIY